MTQPVLVTQVKVI